MAVGGWVEDCTHARRHRHGERRTINCGCCSCPQCYEAGVARRRELYRLRRSGEWQRWHPEPDRVQAHVQMLADSGVTSAQMIERAGVGLTVITKLRQPAPVTEIMPEIAEALLALKPGHIEPSVRAMVPAHGVRRRLEALQAIAWTLTELSHANGRNGNHYRRTYKMSRDVGMVRRHVRDEVEEMYEKFCNTRGLTGPPKGTSFAPPAAWDDIDIDDPDAQPWGY